MIQVHLSSLPSTVDESPQLQNGFVEKIIVIKYY